MNKLPEKSVEITPIVRGEYPKDWWWINVLPEEAAHIEELARSRNQNGKQHGMISKTASSSDDWNISGLAGEWAVGLIYNLAVTRILGRTKLELSQGDVGGWIEVKTARGQGPFNLNMVCNADQLEREEAVLRPYMLALTWLWPKWVIVVGWAYGWEIKEAPISMHGINKHQIHIMDQSKLKPPSELFPVQRRRSLVF